jgi:glycosyltransferase involved in cell wall biosynthesis
LSSLDRSLRSLPAPPPGKSGWPWDQQCTPPADSNLLPKITVVTPSYQQGRFIERTLRSVLLQGYANLEYFVIDGGSSDETAAILPRYAPHLDYWISETDRGQSHALNKGLQRSTGEILCWINSDDCFMPGALATVGRTLAAGRRVFALVGDILETNEDGSPALRLTGNYESLGRLLEFWKGYQMHQPAIFWRREVFERVGLLDESLHFTMDFDYWVRIASHFDFVKIDQILASSHYHPAAKTGDNYRAYYAELRKRAPGYWGPIWSSEFWRLWVSMNTHYVVRPTLDRLRTRLRRMRDALAS